MAQPTESRACPSCGADIIDTPGYRTWCPQCEWNLTELRTKSKPDGVIGRWQSERSRQLGQALYDEVARKSVARPGWERAKVGAYAVALGVHALTLAMVVGAVALATRFPNPYCLFFAFILTLTAIAVRPRFGRLPKNAYTVGRPDAPRLYALLDEIAGELGAKPVDLIVATHDFNAGYGAVGLRRRRILFLGLPLWNPLTDEQRIALLAHEIGHGANGDSRHGLVIGTAQRTLAELYDLGSPHTSALQDASRPGGWAMLWVRLVRTLLRWAATGVYLVLLRLEFAVSQRAEYYADDRAAQIAGTESTAALFDTTMTMDLASMNAFRIHVSRGQTAGLWDRQHKAVAELPGTERDRLRRVASREAVRIDQTHPATHLRLAYLMGRPHVSARIRITEADQKLISAELAPVATLVARDIREAITEQHYS
jgi:Zn-dependent protease with chaperone function